MNWMMHIGQGGPVALLVFLLLLFFSVASWAIILFKWRQIKGVERQNENFLNLFWQHRNFDEIYEKSSSLNQSTHSRLFRACYRNLSQEQRSTNPQPAHLLQDDLMATLSQTQQRELENLEKMTPFLATVGSVSPFIGLFGTVVGIMNAFQSIGQSGNASLASVAPGIAEALIATAAGLFAAIPAVVFYNYFLQKIRTAANRMEQFAGDFIRIVRRNQT